MNQTLPMKIFFLKARIKGAKICFFQKKKSTYKMHFYVQFGCTIWGHRVDDKFEGCKTIIEIVLCLICFKYLLSFQGIMRF